MHICNVMYLYNIILCHSHDLYLFLYIFLYLYIKNIWKAQIIRCILIEIVKYITHKLFFCVQLNKYENINQQSVRMSVKTSQL